MYIHICMHIRDHPTDRRRVGHLLNDKDNNKQYMSYIYKDAATVCVFFFFKQ